jgi:hypothetical protein
MRCRGSRPFHWVHVDKQQEFVVSSLVELKGEDGPITVLQSVEETLGHSVGGTVVFSRPLGQRGLPHRENESSFPTPMIPRKRRTVLWLFQEDYEYLSAVAEGDSDSKNVSMHRLVKALRKAGIKSFIQLDQHLAKLRSDSTKG